MRRFSFSGFFKNEQFTCSDETGSLMRYMENQNDPSYNQIQLHIYIAL